jgi:two-component system OmpR family response regulator
MTSVLVVDDEPSLRMLTRLMLLRLGYTVTEAVEGKQAEVMALETKPDVILLDLMMPDQDGYTTSKHLREQGYTGKIAFVSALSDTGDKQKAHNNGADGYIEKPLAMATLKSQMENLLSVQVV